MTITTEDLRKLVDDVTSDRDIGTEDHWWHSQVSDFYLDEDFGAYDDQKASDKRRILRLPEIERAAYTLAAELITARETLEEWKASQHYSYIGADGKTVKARDLEDELVTARAKLEAAERLAAAAERLRQLHQKSLRTADYHNASCQCPRCIDDEIVAALTAWDAAQ